MAHLSQKVIDLHQLANDTDLGVQSGNYNSFLGFYSENCSYLVWVLVCDFQFPIWRSVPFLQQTPAGRWPRSKEAESSGPSPDTCG